MQHLISIKIQSISGLKGIKVALILLVMSVVLSSCGGTWDPSKSSAMGAIMSSPSPYQKSRTSSQQPKAQVSTYRDLVCKNGKVMTQYGCRYR